MLLLLLCSAAQHLLYLQLQLFGFFFPNISAEILEEADLHLCGSVYQAAFPYIWWFAYYCELDQRFGSDGFIMDKPLSLLLHLLADKEDTTGLALSSEVLKFKQTSKQKKQQKRNFYLGITMKIYSCFSFSHTPKPVYCVFSRIIKSSNYKTIFFFFLFFLQQAF